jgi:hypothetical protein
MACGMWYGIVCYAMLYGKTLVYYTLAPGFQEGRRFEFQKLH